MIKLKSQIEAVKELVLSEVNVKELEFMTSDSAILVKKVKPNFKTLGPKFGQHDEGYFSSHFSIYF